jgi:hypothetical protein
MDSDAEKWRAVREDIAVGSDLARNCVSVRASVDWPGKVLVLLEADYTYATTEEARAYAAAILRVADAIEAGQ